VKKICGTILVLVFLALPIRAEQGANPRVVLETNFGNIVIELFPSDSPVTVANFLQYGNSGFYDGLVFHRVRYGFMIQGGGWYVYDNTIYNLRAGDPIINESYNGLSNTRGTIAMARGSDPDSATSEFYINHVDNLFLDRQYASDGFGYCVFGEVTSGMDVVDAIAETPTIYVDETMKHFPANPLVVIYRIRPISYSSPDAGDITGDGKVDLEDLSEFMSHWLGETCDITNGYCEWADLNYSGVVDFTDFAIFSKNWPVPTAD
jgi:cyclophilin family peptidyl-prolyl cis-trans isomerase